MAEIVAVKVAIPRCRGRGGEWVGRRRLIKRVDRRVGCGGGWERWAGELIKVRFVEVTRRAGLPDAVH